MTNWRLVVFLAFIVVFDVFAEMLWAWLNAGLHTDYSGWAQITVLAYRHLIPLGMSVALSAAMIKRR